MAIVPYNYDKGAATYTEDYSEHYAGALKFARQMLYNVESANPLQWMDKTDVNNGDKLEDLVINLAQSSAWVAEDQTGASVDAPAYPDIRLRIFETWNGRQFKTTVSDNQIRKMLLSGGDDASVAAKIVANLTESEGYEDYVASKGLLAAAVTAGNAIKYKSAPATGVKLGLDLIDAIKDITSDFQFVNSTYVAAQDETDKPLVQRTPFDRIRIVVPYQIMNKLDTNYLSSVFNLSKAEIRGRISEIDEGTNVYVLDEFAVGKVRRLYRLTSRYVEDGLYENFWLTLDRMYYSNGLFKFAYIPVDTSVTPVTPTEQTE